MVWREENKQALNAYDVETLCKDCSQQFCNEGYSSLLLQMRTWRFWGKSIWPELDILEEIMEAEILAWGLETGAAPHSTMFQIELQDVQEL